MIKNKLQPELRFPEFSGDWVEKNLKDVLEFLTTNSFSRKEMTQEKRSVMNIHYGDVHTKFSSLLDVKKNKIPYISDNINLSKVNEKIYCKNGDLVIADASEDYNDIGKSVEIININKEKILSGLHTFLLRDIELFSLGFKNYLFQSNFIKKQIKLMATGVSVLGISKRNLSKIQLPIPTLKEQTKIANFLTSVDEKIDNISKELSLFKDYKKGMMQRIFSQEIRFKDGDGGGEFPEWAEKKLGDVSLRKTQKNKSFTINAVLSVTARFYNSSGPLL